MKRPAKPRIAIDFFTEATKKDAYAVGCVCVCGWQPWSQNRGADKMTGFPCPTCLPACSGLKKSEGSALFGFNLIEDRAQTCQWFLVAPQLPKEHRPQKLPSIFEVLGRVSSSKVSFQLAIPPPTPHPTNPPTHQSPPTPQPPPNPPSPHLPTPTNPTTPPPTPPPPPAHPLPDRTAAASAASVRR